MNVYGFVKLQRGEATNALLLDPCAFALLALVAVRANHRFTLNEQRLGHAQALIGDFRACGLSEKEYRCAKRRLEIGGFVTFLGTPRGTLATLRDGSVFALVDERNATSKGGPSSEENSQKRADSQIGRADQGRTEGGLEGEQKGGLITEVNSQKRADSGADCFFEGREKRATNKKEEYRNNTLSVGAGAPSASKSTIPYGDVLNLFQQVCVPAGLPAPSRLTDSRRRAIAARWGEAGDRPLEWFKQLFRATAASDFLCGKVTRRDGSPPFVASFDWILKPANAAKVVEGNFVNRGAGRDGEARFAQAF